MPNIDIVENTEQFLDGMSNFITEKQWEDMLLQRTNTEIKDWETKLLSPDFILKYKNLLCFDSISTYLALAWNRKNLTVDFMKRFWKHVDFIGKNEDVLLDHKDFNQGDNTLSKVYNEMCDGRSIADIMLGMAEPFTMEELDKRPFHYNGEQWSSSLARMKNVTREFIDKYIHMMSFEAILNNPNLKLAQKLEIRDAYSIAATIEGRELFVFPCGAILEKEEFDNMTPGRAFYANENHIAVKGAKEVAKMLKARFPRAFEDCAYPPNAEVMVDK